MFAAFSLQPWVEGARATLTRLPTDIMIELEPFLDRGGEVIKTQESSVRELVRILAVSLITLVLAVVLAANLYATVKEIGQSEPHERYQQGAAWLTKHVPAGHIIFNTDWDDFPRLFYYDSNHFYVSGLDPNYLFNKDPSLSQLYDRITLGKEDDPGPLIRDRFGATYVFSDNDHHDFFDKANASGWFEVVYEDEECIIMRIRDEKLTPVQQQNEDFLIDGPVGPGQPR
jgi:hypothetical protein